MYDEDETDGPSHASEVDVSLQPAKICRQNIASASTSKKIPYSLNIYSQDLSCPLALKDSLNCFSSYL